MVAKSHNIMYTRVKEKGVCCGCVCVENQLYLPYRLPSAPKWTVSNSTPFFLCKDLFYKNVEAEINQNFKNVLIKNIPQAESRLRTFLFC